MKAFRILIAAVLFVLLAGGGAFLVRERIFEWWLQRNLAGQLAERLGAEVSLDDVRWSEGILTAGRLRISGGRLPFTRLEARDLRTAADWRHFLEPSGQPLSIEASEALMEWPEEAAQPGKAGEAKRPATNALDLDILVAKFSLRRGTGAGAELRESSVRARRTGGHWSFSASGGSVAVPGWPAMTLERAAAEHDGTSWRIPVFALAGDQGGALAGSAAKPKDGPWSGEFSWQDLDLGLLAGGGKGSRFTGTGSGDATLKGGVLRGRMKVKGAVIREVPALVKMASLFAGENWSEIPWETLAFDFVRGTDGTTSLSELNAVSSKGLAVNGSGSYSPRSLSADLQLGVLRRNRPWLVAFMPVLFRSEREGYLWTPVRVGGTPEKPTEDLTTRVVAALAMAPAGGAIEGAADIPGAAVEAAGSLLRGLLGN